MGNVQYQERRPVIDEAAVHLQFRDALREKVFVPTAIIGNLISLQTSFCPEYSQALGSLETSLRNASTQYHGAFGSINALCNLLIPIMEMIIQGLVHDNQMREIVDELREDGTMRLNEASTAFSSCLRHLNSARGITTTILAVIRGEVNQAQYQYNRMIPFFRSRGKLNELESGCRIANDHIDRITTILTEAHAYIQSQSNGAARIGRTLTVLSITSRLSNQEQSTHAQRVLDEANSFQQIAQAQL